VQASTGRLPQRHHSQPSVAATPSASSTPTTTPASPAAANQTVVVNLLAIRDCWVEFTKPNGGFLQQAYIVGGSSKTWTFTRAVNMNIGNPGGIVLTVNGKKLASPGTAGQPVTLSLGPGKPVSG
jgi:cytoskeletal protein RodZ